jgi:hypothetical protein
VHGFLDYSIGAMLIVFPWLFGFGGLNFASGVPVLLGLAAIVYSFFTNYELGAMRLLSMPAHLRLDLFSGIFLSFSPWIFGFHLYAYWPHLCFGLLEICVSVLTVKTPYLQNIKGTLLTEHRKAQAGISRGIE